MPKRARNDSREAVPVFDAQDPRGVYAEPVDVVEPGHLLTSDAPQRLHLEIGARDGWSLVDYSPPGSKPSKSDDDDKNTG